MLTIPKHCLLPRQSRRAHRHRSRERAQEIPLGSVRVTLWLTRTLLKRRMKGQHGLRRNVRTLPAAKRVDYRHQEMKVTECQKRPLHLPRNNVELLAACRESKWFMYSHQLPNPTRSSLPSSRLRFVKHSLKSIKATNRRQESQLLLSATMPANRRQETLCFTSLYLLPPATKSWFTPRKSCSLKMRNRGKLTRQVRSLIKIR